MKKITLTLALIISSGLMFGQVVLSEDFESSSSIPSGWSNNDIASAGDSWIIESTGDAALVAAGNGIVYTLGAAGNYAAFDSDGTSDNGLAENVALESPTFDASSLTQVTIQYNHAFAGNFGGSGFVEVSSDGGSNWTTVTTYTEDGYIGGTVSTDITLQLAGQANAKVRFRWTGNFSVAWYIDNISVFQCTETSAPACPVTISPTQNQMNTPTTAATDGSRQVELSWNSSATAVDYNIIFDGTDLGTTSSTSINIFGLNFNTTYTYEIRANNCFGQSTGCNVITFTTDSCTETSAPACPVTISPTQNQMNTPTTEATDGSRQVELSWNASATAVDYNIIFDGNDLGTTAGTSVNIFGLDYNTTYTYEILANNCFGQSTTCTTITFTTETTLGTQENELLNVSVSPNPTKDILNINTSLQIDKVDVFNLLGRRVISYEKESIYNNSINISSIPAGIYLVNILSDNSTKTIKIIKE
ncbi:T9SS type A sorting domain-containing protein [Winogradskyella jejuensis]|uniref:Por secretion system C-terminal sorting domain-containing protein n=1 Tax=Winogradskyella jejuensis TaxID=1089305 RepID=A0A1M5PI22_9FLAO|nr:T9SS type A sorting domain-containing protein [Winogradskyella jejuensis]SHH01341.1 Por secretion system C-terminal sorting domain-containing protein [Winogradskyella jejuensis]